MSQNDPFNHEDFMQRNTNRAVFLTLKRLDGSALHLPGGDPLHIDVAYEIFGHFGKQERKLDCYVDRCEKRILTAIKQLMAAKVLEVKATKTGTVLAIGYGAPKQLPKLERPPAKRPAKGQRSRQRRTPTRRMAMAGR